MSLRGLDEFITGNWGDDYWDGETPEDEHTFICGFCRGGAHSWCHGKQCDCPGRYGKTAAEHGPYRGPVKLVHDVGEAVAQMVPADDDRQLTTSNQRNSTTSASPAHSHNSFRRTTDMAQQRTLPTPPTPQAPRLQIRKAERKQAKLRLALSGPSGSGKTYSALLIAFGLGGKRIGMIDTERGSGELYSHIGDYDIIALDPPYTVTRYLEAMNMFEVAGYDTIIIDSITHEWAGEGGLLRAKEQIDAKATAGGDRYNPFASWAKITPHHDRFIAAMLGSPCHVIATMRSKMTYVQEGSTIKKRGVEPVQRDQIEYEFTVVLDINVEHIACASKDRTELFGGWMEQITPRVGERLLNWLNNAPLPAQSSQSKALDQLEQATVNYEAAAEASTKHGEARSGNVTRAGQPEAVSSDDALVQAPASPRTDEVEADGRSGVSEPGGEALDAPASIENKEDIAALFKATVDRLKIGGQKNAYNLVLAEVCKFSPKGIPGLLQNQIAECTKVLQNL